MEFNTRSLAGQACGLAGRLPTHCSDCAARVSSLFSWRTRMRIGAAEKWFIVGIIGASICCACFCLYFCTSANAQQLDQKVGQQFDQKFYFEMRWRCIGPFPGGRTVAISGVPHQPNVFYMAAVNGGLRKTPDFGNTGNPIFAAQPSGAVRAQAVSPSPPTHASWREGNG